MVHGLFTAGDECLNPIAYNQRLGQPLALPHDEDTAVSSSRRPAISLDDDALVMGSGTITPMST